MLATGVYVSQLYAKVIELHHTLASVCARHAGDKRQRLSLNCMFRLKHVICKSWETVRQTDSLSLV